MARVLGLCGSLRRDSFNAALLRVISQQLPDGMEIEIFEGLADVPPFNADIDTQPPLPAVARLRAAIRAADGLIVTTPEYNHSIPGVLKNAFNWASRPTTDLSLTGKAAVVAVATRGQHLGFRGLSETMRMLTGFGNIVVPGPEVVINAAHERLVPGPDGTVRLNDSIACDLIRSQLAVLADLLDAGAARTLGESLRRHVTTVWW
jgi:chromate reductase